MAENGSALNETFLNQYDGGLYLSILSISEVTFLGVCLMLTLISSTFIIVILHKVENCFGDMTQFIFKSLAVTDFLTGIFCCGLTMIGLVIGKDRGLISQILCYVGWAACTGLTGLSALLIACACTDRFIAVVYPLRYCTLVTMKRFRVVLGVICSIVLTNAAFSTFRGGFAQTDLCLSDFSSTRLAFRPCLVPSLLISCTSVLVATVTNVKVMFVSSGQSKRSPRVNPPQVVLQNAVTIQHRGNRKGLLVLIATTVTFFVAISPWFIISASHFSHKTAIPLPLARYLSTVLLLSNSWMNAFIFSIFNKRFREAVKRVMCRIPLNYIV